MASRTDMEIFKQFDVKEKDGKERYFCLLDPCREKETCSVDQRCWKIHRAGVHKLDDHSSVPNRWMVRAWVSQGKPIPYQSLPPKNLRNYGKPSSEDDPLDLQPASGDSNVFCQFDIRKVDENPQFFCLLEGCIEHGVSLSRRQNLRFHRRGVHKKLQNLEDIPKGRTIRQWMKLGKPRPYTPTLENQNIENPVGTSATPPKTPPKRVLRTHRNAGPSTEAGPSVGPSEFPPVPKKRRSSRATATSVPATHDGEDAEEALRSMLSIPDDETDSSEYYDPEYYHRDEDLDVDQMLEHPDDQNSMAESLAEFSRQEKLVPQQRPSIDPSEASEGSSDAEVSSEDLMSVAQAAAILMSMDLYKQATDLKNIVAPPQAEDETPVYGYPGRLP